MPSEIKLPSKEEIDRAINKREYKRRLGKTLKRTISVVAVIAALSLLISFFVVPVFEISSDSMSPNLNDGDYIAVLKNAELQRGDIVVFNVNSKILIRRVVAKGGDVIDFDEVGHVIVNGENLNEPYLETVAVGNVNIELPYTVPSGRLFVLSDNRMISSDSRNSAVGCLAEEQVIGKPFLRIWPLADFGTL